MKLILNDITLLKNSLDSISELVEDVTLKVSSENIELRAVDPANVSMILFEMYPKAFKTYEVSETKKISLQLSTLKTILKRFKPKTEVTLSLSELGKLNIQSTSENKKEFNISLLNDDSDKLQIPDMTFDVKINIDSDNFVDSIEDSKIVAESVTLNCSEKGFVITSGSHHTEFLSEFEASDKLKINFLTDEKELVSQYSTEYLSKMIGFAKHVDNICLEFGSGYPLKITYKTELIKLSYILAPRVQN